MLSYLKHWCNRADSVAKKLVAYTNGKSPKEFTEKVYNIYRAGNYKDTIRDTIVDLGKYQKSLRRHEDEILQLAGVGTQLEKVQGTAREVVKTIVWLEELLCLAMVDKALLFEMHAEGKLLYQSV